MALEPPDPQATVVVTGASSGIGAAIARELAARGHGLTLVARRADVLGELADELRGAHDVTVRTHPADLSDAGHRRGLLEALRAEDRVVAGLCNSAGVGALGRIVDHDVEDERRLVAVNVTALHELTTTIAGEMTRRGTGAVLNVGSIFAFVPIPQNATYAATKAFVLSFSEALHTELAGTGVSCTVVSPGPTRTAAFAASGAPGASGMGPGIFWQDPEDVARVAVDGMVAGSRSVIPGLTNKIAALGYQLVPRTLFLPAARLAQSAPVRRALLGDA